MENTSSVTDPNNLFSGEFVVFAGFTDAKLEHAINRAGGKIWSRLSGATILIYDDHIVAKAPSEPSTNDVENTSDAKLQSIFFAAKRLDIKCIPRSYFGSDYLKNFFGETERVGRPGRSIREGSTQSTTDDVIIVATTSDDELTVEDIEEDDALSKEETKRNKSICFMLKRNFPDFYDRIYVPFKLFREGEWNISKVLRQNMDALYHNEEFVTNIDVARFDNVFGRYLDLIKKVFETDTQLEKYMIQWKERRNETYLKKIIKGSKYNIITPFYLADIHKRLFVKYKTDTEKFDKKYTRKLNETIESYRFEKKEFREKFNELLDAYVYEYPIESPTMNSDKNLAEMYTKGFVNGMILAILDFADKLLDLRIYAIHHVVKSVINSYLPLDDINLLDPEDKDYVAIMII